MNKYAALTLLEKYVLLDKGTEPAFSGNYIDKVEQGSWQIHS